MSATENKVSIRDVARISGYAIGTVSRVFNKHPNVTDEARKKILNAAKELDYRPLFKAVGKKIAILIDNTRTLEADLGGKIITYLIRDIINSGYEFEIVMADKRKYEFERYTEGIIGFLLDPENVKKLRSISDIPIVSLNYHAEGCSCVCANHYGGIRTAMQHLMQKGHTKIGITEWNFSASEGAKERLRAYRDALEGKYQEHIYEYVTLKQLYENCGQFLKSGITAAIFCGENIFPLITPLVWKSGLRFPEDISVIGFENPKWGSFQYPGITTVDQMVEEQSATSVRELISMINGKSSCDAVTHVVPFKLIDRGSVKQL